MVGVGIFMAKPIIGITTFDNKTILNQDVKINGARQFEIDKISKAGGLPVLIPLNANFKELLEYLKIIKGLLIRGGIDVNPALYNEKPSSKVEAFSVKKDGMEITLIREAAKRKMPVLGICRGCQMINVAFGGSLYQDIEESFNTKIKHNKDYRKIANWTGVSHKVDIAPKSKLRQIMGKDSIKTNSLHHQAIKKLGKGLSACATTSDKLTEAIEKTDFNQFLLGTQWHPESLNNCDNLFSEFVKYAKNFIRITPLGCGAGQEENKKKKAAML